MESAGHGVRNTEWFHMLNADVISMPDKWEYPWYAAWDLAFHTISLSLVDFDFAKEQLLLMLRSLYAHPNGQIPAYEWNFSDVNPPVHAWATLYLYKDGAEPRPGGPAVPGTIVSGVDAELQLVGQPQGSCRAQRVRRGLSRVSTTSASSTAARSSPRAARWSRRTGRPGWRFTARTCWRSPSFSPNTTRCTKRSPSSSSSISCGSAYAMDRIGEHHDEMWDEQDGFFYDLLRLPDGQAMRLKVRSLVGLLPLCASTVFDGERRRALSEADGDDRPVPQTPSRVGVPCGPDRRGFHRL